MALWKNGRFEADNFVAVADDAPLSDGPVLVSLKRFVAEREALVARNTPLGVLVQPADRLEPIAQDLPRLALLAQDGKLRPLPRDVIRVARHAHEAAQAQPG